jgi:hypothetical protein
LWGDEPCRFRGGDQPFLHGLVEVSIQATAGEQAVKQVFDSAKGLDGTPSQTLPPGQRQTFTVAFGLPSAGPTDFRVQINPSMFGYQPVFYTGHV